MDSDLSASVFYDADLTALMATLDVTVDRISANKASFSAFYGTAPDHIAVVGTFTLDSSGDMKSLKGTFVRSGIADDCYSKGSVTGRRIN